MDLVRLLKFGFFPKELPPPFSTIEIGDFANRPGAFPRVADNYVSRPCFHNLARPGNQRRALALLNPFNFYKIAELLSNQSLSVQNQISKSSLSLTKPNADIRDKRAYAPRLKVKDLLQRRAKVRSNTKFILKADIARFYPSVYTHAIPWAIMGKTWSKANKTGGFANDLDKFVRNAQEGQTLGLPIGPDTSFIISEMIGAAIDEQIQSFNWQGYRFVDDFEFGFLSRSEAEQALPRLEACLSTFELALNSAKTSVEELPVAIENSWRIAIKRFNLPNRPDEMALVEYFNLLFELYRQNITEPVLRYGIARLRSIEFKETKVLLDLLMQCILVEPGTLKESLHLMHKREMPIAGNDLKILLAKLIDIHGPMKHGTEVAWSLWAAIRYNIRLSDQTLAKLEEFDDSVIALLCLHANHLRLLSDNVKHMWGRLMTHDSLIDGHWLLAYEADLKGWLETVDARNHIDSDPLFSVLKANNVSFYNDQLELDEDDDSDDYGTEENEDEEEEDEDDRAFD